MNAIRELNIVSTQIQRSREDVKNVEIRNFVQPNEIDLQQLIVTCLEMTQKFIDNLKYLAKKTSISAKIGPEHIGHLIPLTVGHRDPPREDKEVPYIEAIFRLGNFRYEDPDILAPSPLQSVINDLMDSPGAPKDNKSSAPQTFSIPREFCRSPITGNLNSEQTRLNLELRLQPSDKIDESSLRYKTSHCAFRPHFFRRQIAMTGQIKMGAGDVDEIEANNSQFTQEMFENQTRSEEAMPEPEEGNER